MLRRATMAMAMAAALGLGALAGTGAAVPWRDWREARAAQRLADADRAEELFALRFRMYAEGGWRPAQPLSLCEACIAAAADQGQDRAAARASCGTACGME